MLPHNQPCAPAIALDATDDVYVLHTVLQKGEGLRVSKLVQGQWMQLGASVNSEDVPVLNACPRLVVTKAGVPTVAYILPNNVSTGAPPVWHVKTFDGTSWAEVGAAPASQAQDVDLALDSKERLVTVTVDLSPTPFINHVVAHTFDGTAWQPIGGGFATEARNARLALQPDDTMFVAATRGASFDGHLGAFKFDGSAWVAVGPEIDSIPNTTQSIDLTDLTADATHVTVSWIKTLPDFESTSIAHSAELQGGAAVELGDGKDKGRTPVVAFFGGNTVQGLKVAGGDSVNYDVRRFIGGAWGPRHTLPLPILRGNFAARGANLYLAHSISSGGGAGGAKVVRVNVP